MFPYPEKDRIEKNSIIAIKEKSERHAGNRAEQGNTMNRPFGDCIAPDSIHDFLRECMHCRATKQQRLLLYFINMNE